MVKEAKKLIDAEEQERELHGDDSIAESKTAADDADTGDTRLPAAEDKLSDEAARK